ncbi:protein kinase [Kitasatospora sp. NPDC002227]|uniref:protein kinase domain-containing protein n=1 Tax=Kitasatospora sp. NPDC002227 TaxID=3154773 RepID=UPI003325CD72
MGEHSLGNGRYVLQHLLGEGGMASVHLAYDTVLDRQVAVKTLHTELGREQSFRERFRREAQAVARLQHPNVVAVFDSGEDAGPDGATVPYIVMEYVEGKALRDQLNEAIRSQGALPAAEALRLTAEVLAALEASHDHGLVHRDIKPGNVMVTAKGVVKVMDFGIARALQSGVTSMTQTGMVVGTPQYLSPEQALGKSVDARSDLYSVGCLLFELVTGQTPFDGDSPFSIAYKHVQEEPPAPSSLNPAVPPAVDALVARAMRKDPAQRFPTAEAMRQEVERVSAGGGAGTPLQATPLQASTPLVIGEGPRSVHAAPSLVNFPQVPGDLPPVGTPLPGYQAPTPPPYGPQTPPPYPTPQPFPAQPVPGPQYGTPQPFPQQYNAAPQFQTPPPGYQQPYQPAPQPPKQRMSGCATVAIVVGVLVALIVLALIIVGAAATKTERNRTHSTYGSERVATGAAVPR